MSQQPQTRPDTLPKCLLHHYRKFGGTRIALREKDRGIWRRYTWADYYSIVQRLAMAFLELGLQKGDKVAIIGENKPHVYWAELAALACGAPVLGIFSDCTPPGNQVFSRSFRFDLCGLPGPGASGQGPSDQRRGSQDQKGYLLGRKRNVELYGPLADQLGEDAGHWGGTR